MALNKCKECGGEVSDKAKTCPKCGAPVKKSGMSAMVIVVAVIFILIIFSMILRETNTPQTATKAAIPEQSSISITAEDLYKEYEANEIAADKKYKGKSLNVRGKIRNIGKTLGEPYVNLATGKYSHQVMVSFPDKKYDDKLSQYSTGTNIEVTGTCKGNIMGMIIISLK